MAIKRFDGPYRWLSNFWPSEVVFDRHPCATVEHAYQAAKFPSGYCRDIVRDAQTPAEAKKTARAYINNANEDWRARKEDVMFGFLRQKFAPGTELAGKLDETGDQQIVEGNDWGDKFWGVCDGEGLNRLGEMIMEIRAENRL